MAEDVLKILLPIIVLVLTTTRCYAISGHLEAVYECTTSGPLGMITGNIEDWQISASSTQLAQKDKRCAEKYGRVYQPNGYAWCAKFKSSTEWLQIDLGVPTKVTGLITQGKGDGQEWVTSFMLSYSLDAFRWKYIDDPYGNQRVFEGNSDSYRLKHIYLDEAIFARFVKFHTLHWNGHPSLRVEIIGCQTCKRLVGLPPYVQLTASSELSFKKGRSCRAEDGHILTNNGWCAKSDDENQWLQYDVGPPALITGIVTKGRGDTAKKQWVTKFRLSYSNDSRVWHYYKDANHLPPKEFGANADKHLERYHFLNNPFIARFVRFNPAAWNTKISMRAGLIGCPHIGECEEGFMHVHPDTPCVENLSYKKESWINSRKQYKRHTGKMQTAKSNAALAVDGNMNTTFQSCTILDNYYVETPIWSVDLGDKRRVSGIVILTWQAKNQEHRTSQKENIYNLDRMVVSVDTKERPPTDEQQQCGSVSRQNEAIMKPRIHIQCARTLEGRYVHIQAWGVPNRRNRLFSAVLCEVMVYA